MSNNSKYIFPRRFNLHKLLFLFTIIFLFNPSSLFALPGTLEWQSIDAGSGQAIYSDSGYSSKLSEGCLVQLILDVDGDGLDSIENTGSADPTGDDIIMPVTSGDNTGQIGANLPFDKPGHFQYSAGFNGDQYAGKNVYVRFWNSASPGVGSLYGESTGYTLLNAVLPQIFNIVVSGSLYTNKTLAEEEEEEEDPNTSLTVKVYDPKTDITITAPLIMLYKDSGVLADSTTDNPCTFTVEKRASYYLRVEKQGYIFPSNEFSGSTEGDHGEVFTMGTSPKEINIPVDRGDVLTIRYSVNKKEVVVGDIATFNIHIENNSSLAQENVVVKASRINALKYLNRAYLDNQKIEPTGGNPSYNFLINSISGNGSSDLIYQTIVTPGAFKGMYESVAVSYRQSSDDQVSNSDSVKILVGEDPLMDRGTIIGKVFLDKNANGIQDKPLTPPSPLGGEGKGEGDEPGISGIPIVTEYGVIVVTDKNGKYHIPDVPAGRHIIKVMDTNLPEEDMIVLENPRWINTTEGILNKVNFGVIKREVEKKETAKKEEPRKGQNKGFIKKAEEKVKTGKREKVIQHRREEISPRGKYIREEKYELVEKEVEELGPDGKVIKKRIKGYLKTEFVGEVEVIEEKKPELQLMPPPEVVIVKGEEEVEKEPVPELAKKEGVKRFKMFKDIFLVAFVEGTLRKNTAGGNEEIIAEGDKTLKEGWRGEGRLAFTLLTKLFNKINLIASLDTDRIKTAARKYIAQQKIMTNLYEDKYYPAYGDASQIDYSGTDTQDILYAKATCGGSEAVWGGYKMDMPLYQKAYSGGNIRYRSEAKTKFNETKTEIDSFYAKSHHMQAHDEFIGTGGSLYYLENKEIIEGSEQLKIMVKDRITGRVLAEMPLKDEYDYTINYDSGRILLNKPLSSVSYSAWDSVISNDILAGNQIVLSTDYTYWTDEMKRNAYGGRVKQNITDHLAVEGMYIEEEKAEEPYKLYGGKAVLRLNNDTFISGRYSKSEETVLASGLSYDGGFNYTINGANWSDNKNGAEIDIQGRSLLFNRVNLEAGYTDTGSHFNTTESLDRSGRKVLFANIVTPLTDAVKAGIKYNRQRAKEDAFNTSIRGNTDFDITSGFVSFTKNKLDAVLEVQHQTVSTIISNYEYMGTIPLRNNNFIGAKIGYKLSEKLYSYIRGQGTIKGVANNQVTLGADYAIKKDYSIKIAETAGNLGNSTLLGLNKTTDDGISSYTTMEMGSFADTGKYVKTVSGQSAPISANGKAYYETDYSSFRERVIQGNVIGYEQEFLPGFYAGTNYERSHYYNLDNLVNRDSAGVNISYLDPDILRILSRVEIRDDKMEAERDRQWITSNYLHWYLTRDLSLLGKIAWSETKDTKLKNLKARYNEMGAGLAYRPVNYDRLNILAKYNYITDLPPLDQTTSLLLTDSKKHIIGIEGSFDICRFFELAGKFAYRAQEDSVGISEQESNTSLYIGRVNVHVAKKWDVCGEYRVLDNSKLEARKSGFLVEVQRSILDNFQLGGGYNFTDFNDDLTNSDDYDSKGWFVRVSGKY